MKDYVVYLHKNKTNGKLYVGITNDVDRRWRCGGIEYKPQNGERQRPFWNAIEKNGWDGFEHEILESGLTAEQAYERERFFISLFRSRNRRFGYNVAEGGNGGRVYQEHPRGMAGKHHSDEKKRQQSELMKKLNAEGKMKWKNGHPKGMKGKHHSEEFKSRLRAIPSGEHPSAKPVVIEYRDGREERFECLKYLSQHLGIDKTTLTKTIKSGKPYVLSKHCYKNLENLRKIEGAKIYYQTTSR